MKIVKGVLLYTVIIIGIALVIAMLLVGAMFLFPKFEVFGWKIMHKSNETIKDTISKEITSSSVQTIEIDAGLHDVRIHQFEGETKYILVNKTDDMFGFYKGEYDNKVSIDDSKYNKFVISVSSITGAVLPRDSRLDIYVPNSKSYNFIIRTTSGDISLDGTTKKLNINSLNISTDSGNFNWKNINSTIFKKGADSYSWQVVGEVDTKDENYKKENYKQVVFINDLKATTNSGTFNFKMENGNVANFAIAPIKSGNGTTANVMQGMFANSNKNAWLSSFTESNQSNFYFEAKRGEFLFDDIFSYGGLNLSFIGNDVLVDANAIQLTTPEEQTSENPKMFSFMFNAPNGFFKINELSASLSTIITNNIDVKLDKVHGELSITTTYGDINISNVTENASLKSTHGNITVGNATASLSAISEYGDITVNKYSNRLYLKNRHGKITASFNREWFEANKLSISNEAYKTTVAEMANEDGSINVSNLVFETKLTTTKGGAINASFYEMHKADSQQNQITHQVVLTGGSANVQITNLVPFMFKGKGSISGSVGSATITASDDFKQILSGDASYTDKTMAKLDVQATNASVNFSTYHLV